MGRVEETQNRTLRNSLLEMEEELILKKMIVSKILHICIFFLFICAYCVYFVLLHVFPLLDYKPLKSRTTSPLFTSVCTVRAHRIHSTDICEMNSYSFLCYIFHHLSLLVVSFLSFISGIDQSVGL